MKLFLIPFVADFYRFLSLCYGEENPLLLLYLFLSFFLFLLFCLPRFSLIFLISSSSFMYIMYMIMERFIDGLHGVLNKINIEKKRFLNFAFQWLIYSIVKMIFDD